MHYDVLGRLNFAEGRGGVQVDLYAVSEQEELMA